MDLVDLAPDILSNVVPQARFAAGDQQVLDRHGAYLASLADDLVTEFYDTVFAHGPTARVFRDGEREEREKSFHGWWLRTVSAPLDADYYTWMTLVGVLHIRRRVKNPMMLAMMGHVVAFVTERARRDLGPDEAAVLAGALGHLHTTIAALISDSYTQAYIASLESVAGFSPELTERMLDLELKRLSEQFDSGR